MLTEPVPRLVIDLAAHSKAPEPTPVVTEVAKIQHALLLTPISTPETEAGPAYRRGLSLA